jgi:hypothetical protein
MIKKKISLVIFFIVVVICFAVIIFFVFLPYKIPNVLQQSTNIKTIPVLTEKFDDYKNEKLNVYLENGQIVKAKLSKKPILNYKRVGFIDGNKLNFTKDYFVKNLITIQNSQSFIQTLNNNQNSNIIELTVDTQLKTPINSMVVSPVSIVEYKNDFCVFSGNRPYLINILSSQLGKSIITFKNNVHLKEIEYISPKTKC